MGPAAASALDLDAWRLAAQLRREPMTCDADPNRDARALLAHAYAARVAAVRKSWAAHRAELRNIRAIARLYSASVVDHRDVNGMVVGLTFVGGTHKSACNDWFYLA